MRPFAPARVSTPEKKPARSRRTFVALPSESNWPRAPSPCAQNTTSCPPGGLHRGLGDDRRLAVGERARLPRRPRMPAARPCERRHLRVAAVGCLTQPAEHGGADVEALVHQHGGGRGMNFAGDLIEGSRDFASARLAARDAAAGRRERVSSAPATAFWLRVVPDSCHYWRDRRVQRHQQRVGRRVAQLAAQRRRQAAGLQRVNVPERPPAPRGSCSCSTRSCRGRRSRDGAAERRGAGHVGAVRGRGETSTTSRCRPEHQIAVDGDRADRVAGRQRAAGVDGRGADRAVPPSVPPPLTVTSPLVIEPFTSSVPALTCVAPV